MTDKNYTDAEVVLIEELEDHQLLIEDTYSSAYHGVDPIDLREVLKIGQRIRWAALKEELPGLLKAVPEDANECVVAKMVNCGATFSSSALPGVVIGEDNQGEPVRFSPWAADFPASEQAATYVRAIYEELHPDYPEVEIRAHGSGLTLPVVLGRLAAHYDGWGDDVAFLIQDGLLDRKRAADAGEDYDEAI